MRRAAHLTHLAYGTYAYVVFAVFGLSALAAALVVPGLERRRTIARKAARLFLLCARMRLTVRGLERLPEGQCIVVANHASYLDGVVFTAALPPRFSFVIKREMARVPLAGPMLSRIGAEFIERFDRRGAAADARRLFRKAERGESMVFFPEGTFAARPGLLKFHSGAFHAAARAGCPVVPAVIRGTRRALPPDRILPRAETISIEVLPAIVASSLIDSSSEGAEPAASVSHVTATELRERARSAILSRLTEPDLEVA